MNAGIESGGSAALIERVKSIILKPKYEWPKIEAETTSQGDRGGSVCLHRDRQRISGSSAGCFLELPIWGVMQGGRSPTGMTPHIGGQLHAATKTGRLSKYV